MSKYGVISVPYFPVFELNTEKYGTEVTPYLDTFHAVLEILIRFHCKNIKQQNSYKDVWPCHTSLMQSFGKIVNSKANNYFHKKPPSYVPDWIRNTSLNYVLLTLVIKWEISQSITLMSGCRYIYIYSYIIANVYIP